jgi:hypothetical protein
MKIRKTKELASTLKRKGFEEYQGDHKYYHLVINGIKQHIYTRISHGTNEYNPQLMSQVKKQLRFADTKSAENFFDCPMSGDDYVEMLKKNREL